MGPVSPYAHLVRSARPGVVFVPRRTISYTPIRRAEDSNDPNNKPENQSTLGSIKNFFFGKKSDQKPTITRRPSAPPRREGSLSADSIFADDDSGPKLKPTGRTPKTRKGTEPAEGPPELDYSIESRNPDHMRAALDPKPKSRIRWQRRMITREIRRRGRIPKEVQIMRTERESLSKSHWFKTSIKKLGPLSRQIAGKNIDDAIVQMRFSKKKAAKDVLEHLQHAKNVAVVRNGLGLDEGGNGSKRDPTTVVLKSGERKTITDPAAIYIAQAWVNRGPYGRDADHRARGQINMLRPPSTALSVLLKEEKTRLREWEDREEKALRQRRSQLWTHLPNRKVYAQNQYYSW